MNYLMNIYEGVVHFMTSPDWVSSFGTFLAAVVALWLGVRKKKLNIIYSISEHDQKLSLFFRNLSTDYIGLVCVKNSKCIEKPYNRILNIEPVGSLAKTCNNFPEINLEPEHTDCAEISIKLAKNNQGRYFFIVFKDVITNQKFKVKCLNQFGEWRIDKRPFTKLRVKYLNSKLHLLFLKRKQ